jgi:hypothetical protein
MSTTVRGAAAIPLPIPACWAKMRDLTRAKDYVPGLSDAVVTTALQEGVGASRIVSHRQFGDMNESVVAWDEGRGMTLRLHKIDARGDAPARPFAEAFFRYEFRPARDGESSACEIHTALTYRLPFGLLGRIVDRLFLRRVFRRNVVDAAVSLAENYRTDRPVPATELPRLRRNALPACP